MNTLGGSATSLGKSDRWYGAAQISAA